MKAMILAAGLGTRLRPLTAERPKVLVPVMGTTVLEFWIDRLYRAGCEAIIINAFHMHDELMRFIYGTDWPVPVHIQVESSLLDTGGGVRNVLSFFNGKSFIVVNGDIICNAPIADLYREHLDSGVAVSLLLHHCHPFNNVAVNQDGVIMGFGRGAKYNHGRCQFFAFTGIHFIHPYVLLPLEPGMPESIISVYRKMIDEDRPPRGVFVPDLYWREMGTLESYWALNQELSQLPKDFLPPITTGEPVYVHPRAKIASGVHFEKMVVVGRDSHIMEETRLDNVIVWENVVLGPKERLRDCIVTEKSNIITMDYRS